MRLYVTPILTCYWQIQPHRNELGFDELARAGSQVYPKTKLSHGL